MKTPKVSIIIRTKNEERWISPCLEAIHTQKYKDFEVIIVDNDSTDRTVIKAKKYPIKKIINITNYLPGKALNLGIENAEGKYIVCLSAHCIPTNSKWLATLVSAIEEEKDYAGVYGRQEPMTFSTPADKRDMLIVFGLDRKVQIKDSFFHNANSIFHRKLWEEVQFDNDITNIEDRLWANEMIQKGYKLLYEPEASTFHYHGIHQNGNNERLKNVVSIIESHNPTSISGRLDADNLIIIAILPIKGKYKSINGCPLLKYSIDALKKSKFIDKIIVSTDSEETANIAIKTGAECPFLRPKALSEPFVNLEAVQKYSLEIIEEQEIFPDLVIHLEETFPFRPDGLFDGMIRNLLKFGHDSVIAARGESSFIWQENHDGGFNRIDSGDVPREFKEKILIGLHGLGCVSHPEFIRTGKFLGPNIGLFEIDDNFASFEVRDSASLEKAKKILNVL